MSSPTHHYPPPPASPSPPPPPHTPPPSTPSQDVKTPSSHKLRDTKPSSTNSLSTSTDHISRSAPIAPSTNGTSNPSSPHNSSRRQPRKSGQYSNLLLYTRAVPLPKRVDTITEYRFLLRLTQTLIAAASFVSLVTSTFNVNYAPYVLATSGMNMMVLTSISSFFVSFCCILVYFFPSYLSIPPHRHPRFSRVEVSIDFLYILGWFGAASAMLYYRQCPRIKGAIPAANNYDTTAFNLPGIINDNKSCQVSWLMCIGFGYGCAVLFMTTFVMGLRDLWLHGFWGDEGNSVMFARGSWKEIEKEE
ncbi:hypothetical protein HDV00_006750 [Rhizophlyctis rosea]|nr:hypothetical protein HDV00_006750 [Rhizophlyctis rosea]